MRGRYGWSYFFLHVGLGMTFLWIGIDMFRHPTDWIGFLPDTLPFGLTREGGLQLTAVLDTVLGIVLILQVFPKLTAAFAAAHLAGIIALHGVDAVLIRDVGLLGASLALFFWPRHYRKHFLGRLWPFGRRRYRDEE